MLRFELIVADCAHSGHADLDSAMADVEEKPGSRAVGLLCASAFQFHKLQSGEASVAAAPVELLIYVSCCIPGPDV